jgi:hypothetical protein
MRFLTRSALRAITELGSLLLELGFDVLLQWDMMAVAIPPAIPMPIFWPEVSLPKKPLLAGSACVVTPDSGVDGWVWLDWAWGLYCC